MSNADTQMPSIRTSAYPLVFKVAPSLVLPAPALTTGDGIAIRTLSRALAGMQKEAIVNDAVCGHGWRMVCDEGPWLNGTDLSSFPLGFFSAGMVAAFASEIVALAARRRVEIGDLRIVQDARYTIEGSAIKRTMTGSALPLETEVAVKSSAARATVETLLCAALAASPADAVMRTALPGRFRITKNDRAIDNNRLPVINAPVAPDPETLFDRIQPTTSGDVESNIIEKLAPVGSNEVRRGLPVGYAAEQKRLVEVRSVLTRREDGLKVIDVQCIKPEGSVFRFLSDDPVVFGGQGRAPTGLQYFSAAVAFCFMTQLGRYAGIVKQDLSAYRIVQDTHFSLPGASAGTNKPATAGAVDTQVFLTSAADDDANRVLVEMGEQTCYLHACYRGVAKTRLRIIA